MKDDKYFFDYNIQPGLTRKQCNRINVEDWKPVVSIITSYYNAHEYMSQTVNCVLNQTFPHWEWIIVDDGSDNQDAIDYLEKVKSIDFRISIYRKQNEGLAKGRDYAISKSNTNLIVPLDSDDLIVPTYIESLYITLLTNKDASWAYSNSVGFGKYNYLYDKQFDSNKMRYENLLTATAMIRKEKIIEAGGYGEAKRFVNEDWHLWLRMIANNNFPVQTGFYGFWYRRREKSLLVDINDEKNKLRLEEIKKVANRINHNVFAKIYPNSDEKIEIKKTFNYGDIKIKQTKEPVLYIIDCFRYNKSFLRKLKKESEDKTVYVISLETGKKSSYVKRQEIEEYCSIYELPTFIDSEYYGAFIDYLIDTRLIKEIYICNQLKETSYMTKYIDNANFFTYKRTSFAYFVEKAKYIIKNFIIVRGIRKVFRKICNKRKDDRI